MEGPLYGETTKVQKTLFYGATIIFGLFTLAAILTCVIVAIMDKHFGHLVLVFSLIVLTVAIVFMVSYCDYSSSSTFF